MVSSQSSVVCPNTKKRESIRTTTTTMMQLNYFRSSHKTDDVHLLNHRGENVEHRKVNHGSTRQEVGCPGCRKTLVSGNLPCREDQTCRKYHRTSAALRLLVSLRSCFRQDTFSIRINRTGRFNLHSIFIEDILAE